MKGSKDSKGFKALKVFKVLKVLKDPKDPKDLKDPPQKLGDKHLAAFVSYKCYVALANGLSLPVQLEEALRSVNIISTILFQF